MVSGERRKAKGERRKAYGKRQRANDERPKAEGQYSSGACPRGSNAQAPRSPFLRAHKRQTSTEKAKRQRVAQGERIALRLMRPAELFRSRFAKRKDGKRRTVTRGSQMVRAPIFSSAGNAYLYRSRFYLTVNHSRMECRRSRSASGCGWRIAAAFGYGDQWRTPTTAFYPFAVRRLPFTVSR